ncbi:MAG TPA: hypothetical protein DDX71_07745 [Ruminococcus sp.]|nr:hypothetical protein [Ruminococcus sp.]
MNLSILKKSIPAVMMAAICAASLSAAAVTASAADNEDEQTFATGLPAPTAEEAAAMNEFFGEPETAEDSENPTVFRLPTSIDLSTNSYFPAIVNQDGIGSCTSFATTYYQFSYEAYKGTDVDLKNRDNIGLTYSPLFTYNFCNGGEAGPEVGVNPSNCFNVLANQGCLKQDVYPYCPAGETYVNKNNINRQWPTDTDALREALGKRVVDQGQIITNTSDDAELLKAKIFGGNGADGHVLTFATHYSSLRYKKWYNPDTQQDEDVAYVCDGLQGGHMMTIVGYNDNVWIDINGNDIREPEEYGAFKVANSHGAYNHNNGYIWVSYDAMNKVSKVPGAAESASRVPVFQFYNNNYNTLYWITVGDIENYYVGEAIVDTDKRDTLSVKAARSAQSGYVTTERKVYNRSYNSHLFSFDGPIVFAYDDLSDPIEDYLTGYNFGVDIDGTINDASFRILDSKGNVVKDFGTVTTDAAVKPINLKMGDLNYDGALNEADNTIYEAEDFSDLQEVLAQNYNYNNHNNHNYNLPNGEVTCIYNVEGDQVTVTVINASSEKTLSNWALRADNFYGTPSDFWGADFIDGVIYSKDYNSVLLPNESTTFGYKISNYTGDQPEFTLVSSVVELTDEDVAVSVEYNGWNATSGLYTITISNVGDEAINGWSISFSADGLTINSAWGAVNSYSLEDGVYTLNCANYNGNNVIGVGSSVVIYLSVSTDGTPVIDNIVVNATSTIE